MRKAVLGTLIGAGLVIAAAASAPERSDIVGQRLAAPSVAANGDLIVASVMAGDKCQQLTVIDPKAKVISVYHVELATGNVKLCCVRNIHWDLQMMHFNGESPLPREIQSLLESR